LHHPVLGPAILTCEPHLSRLFSSKRIIPDFLRPKNTVVSSAVDKMATATPKPMTLEQLPVDVMFVLISHLDPVSLISISQTSQSFRDLINPQRYHFVQRLLALELDPQIGGITPRFRDGDDQKLTPPAHDEAWNDNLYACSNCLKLRLHTLFDNNAILRLRFRKPPRGSHEWNRMQRTEWAPLRGGLNYKHRAMLFQEDKEKREAIRARYSQASAEYLQAQNQAGFDRVDRGHVDELADEVESYLVGTERHKRLCLDCRFARGDFNRPTKRGLGTPEQPIVRSRLLRIPTDGFSRLFPGLLPPLDKWPIVFRVYHMNRRSKVIPMYAARCRGCHIWQDFYCGFRQRVEYQWEPRPNWDDKRFQSESDPETPLCNACIVGGGEEERFKTEFRNFAMDYLSRSLRQEFWSLIFGWRIIRQEFDLHLKKSSSLRPKSLLHDYQDVGKQILEGLKWEEDGEIDVGNCGEDYRNFDVTDLRRRYELFRTFLETQVPRSVVHQISTGWFRHWYEEYEVYEASFLRSRDALKKAKGDMQWLWDYALEPGRFHMSRFRVLPEGATCNIPDLRDSDSDSDAEDVDEDAEDADEDIDEDLDWDADEEDIDWELALGTGEDVEGEADADSGSDSDAEPDAHSDVEPDAHLDSQL